MANPLDQELIKEQEAALEEFCQKNEFLTEEKEEIAKNEGGHLQGGYLQIITEESLKPKQSNSLEVNEIETMQDQQIHQSDLIGGEENIDDDIDFLDKITDYTTESMQIYIPAHPIPKKKKKQKSPKIPKKEDLSEKKILPHKRTFEEQAEKTSNSQEDANTDITKQKSPFPEKEDPPKKSIKQEELKQSQRSRRKATPESTKDYLEIEISGKEVSLIIQKEHIDKHTLNKENTRKQNKLHSLIPKLSSHHATQLPKLDLDILRSQKEYYPQTNLSYADYYYKLPRCSICFQTGVILTQLIFNQLKEFNNKGSKGKEGFDGADVSSADLQLHAFVFGYALIQCRSCGVLVHNNCYFNIQNYNEWNCDMCLMQVSKSELDCLVCNQAFNRNTPEAFLKFQQKNAYAHFFCALWIPEITLHNQYNTAKSSIGELSGIDEILNEENETHCIVCKNTKGAFINCMYPSCTQKYHPLCGRNEHFFFKIVPLGNYCNVYYFQEMKLQLHPIATNIQNWPSIRSIKLEHVSTVALLN